MQANWSLILNVLLLTGVVIALVRVLKTKKVTETTRHPVAPTIQQPPILNINDKPDDVIAVRKITREPSLMQSPSISTSPTSSRPNINASFQESFGVVAPPPGLIREPVKVAAENKQAESQKLDLENKVVEEPRKESTQQTLMIFLLAKENRQLAGYELLQTILAAGLRFGEGQLFHRHQFPNGQGPILCSLATATASGVFDLQNIGAFSVHGLCLFMQTSGNAAIDVERLSVMIDTAKQLSEGLDTYMLDEARNPWNDASEARYEGLLAVVEEAVEV